ncbi:peptidoglycan-binding domain-containing protein [Streptomyces sp. NPDC059611]|uniref:peptidoglycan-binding domain-containing protein n=1 Tax=unclassified Streptomyces TaxID=2593676 RepID=UPI00367ACE83
MRKNLCRRKTVRRPVTGLPRRTLAALAAVVLLAAAPTAAAHASTPPPPASAQGLRTFQQSYGLAPTGQVDTATAHLLKTAPDSHLRAAFADPSDLGPEQLAHARTVIGVGKGADIPEQGQVIALMTAMQESKFVNYTTPVDHDSLGIFQQRPSMGWGTPKQITHVPTASKSFYGLPSPTTNPGLLQIKGWQSMEPGKACQAVQRSAYPDRYAQWEGFARKLLEREGPTVDPIG